MLVELFEAITNHWTQSSGLVTAVPSGLWHATPARPEQPWAVVRQEPGGTVARHTAGRLDTVWIRIEAELASLADADQVGELVTHHFEDATLVLGADRIVRFERRLPPFLEPRGPNTWFVSTAWQVQFPGS